MATDAVVRPWLGVPTKLAYGIGAAAFGIKDNGFRTFLLIFYNQVVGLPAITVTIAILIALVMDAFLDPIIGQWSDNLRSAWGRRHPFMYAAAVPAAVSYLLLWNPPYHAPQPVLIAYLVAVAVLTRTFITLFEIPSAAQAAEMTDDYDQRTSIASYRVLFGWWGGLTLYIFALAVLFKAAPGYPDGRLNPAAYGPYALIAAGAMFFCIVVSAIGTHHFIPWMKRTPVEAPRSVGQNFREMVSTLGNKPFLVIALVGIFAAAAEGIGFALGQYILVYFWQVTPGQQALLGTEAYISSLVAFGAAPLLTRMTSKKRAAIVFLALAIFFTALPLALRLSGLFWPNGHPYLLPTLYVLGTIRGVFGITTSILIIAMISDVVEDSQLKTGRRSEGLFFAAMSFIGKVTSGAGLMITGLLLSLVKFPIGTAPSKVPPEIVRNMVLLYLPTMAALYLIALGFIFLYRITRESHAETLATLKAMQAQDEGAAPGPN